MQSRNLRYGAHKLALGLRLRCPECTQGRLFVSHFKMEAKCPYCGVRYTRSSGDAIGGVYINVAFAEITALMGFILVHNLTDIPIIHQLLFWVPYVIVFIAVFYPYARGLWIGVMYLTGGIYADPDYMREYIAPYHNAKPQQSTEQE